MFNRLPIASYVVAVGMLVGAAIIGGCQAQVVGSKDGINAGTTAEALTAEKIMAQVKQTYAQCKSYRDSGVVTTTFIESSGTRTVKKPFTTAFIRPDRFRFEFREKDHSYIIMSKGNEVKTWWDIQPVIQKGKSLGMAIAAATGVSGGSAHTVPNLLMAEVIGGRIIADVAETKRLDDGKASGRDCYRIQGLSRDGTSPSILWIEKGSFLLRKIDEQHKFERFRTETVTSYEPVVNGNIADALLEFNLPPSAAGKETVSVAEPSPAETAMMSAVYDAENNGRKLSAAQADDLAKKLTQTEKDIPLLTELLGYYSAHSRSDATVRKKHYETIILMIRNYPHAAVLTHPAGLLMPWHGDGAIAKELWQEHFRRNPKDLRLLGNAGKNMLLVDMTFAESCFAKGKELEPDNSRWTIELASLQSMKNRRNSGNAKAKKTVDGKKSAKTVSPSPSIMIKAQCTEKSSGKHATSVSVADIPVITTPNTTATVKMVARQNWLDGKDPLEPGIVLQVLPVVTEEGITLTGKLLISTLDFNNEKSAGGQGNLFSHTVSSETRFRVLIKNTDTSVKLPPIKFNGRITEVELQAYFVDRNGKPVTPGK